MSQYKNRIYNLEKINGLYFNKLLQIHKIGKN